MPSNTVYEPYEQAFTNVNTVVIQHDFSRGVSFTVYIDDLISEAYYEYIDENSFRLKFYEAGILTNKTGRVVVC